MQTVCILVAAVVVVALGASGGGGGAAAASTEQGKGFKVPFYPGNSSRFQPEESSTFRTVPHAEFLLTYADNSKLVGYQAMDVVQLGDYYVYTKFGAITDCNSPDFNNVSGILGLGLPTMPMMMPPGIAAPTMPRPLLFDLSDTRVKDNDKNKILQRRAFSFYSTEVGAELQLGGYDPAAVDGDMFVLPSIEPSEYMVPVLSIKFGDVELLEFTEEAEMMRGVLDSGTSCLVLPDVTAGMLQSKPYSKWLSIVKDKNHPAVRDTFHINIAGKEFDIPYESWYMANQTWSVANQSCVQSMPANMPLILIGDVLFREYLVMFDLDPFENGGPIMLGLGKQNKKYTHGSKYGAIKKIPMSKEKVTGVHRGNYLPPQATSLVPVQNFECSQYFVEVHVGTPRQTFRVILDSGSSEFGVFSQCPQHRPGGLHCDFGMAGDPVEKLAAPYALLETSAETASSEENVGARSAIASKLAAAVLLIQFAFFATVL